MHAHNNEQEYKQRLRKEIGARRRHCAGAAKQEADEAIRTRIACLEPLASARVVAAFFAIAGEPDLTDYVRSAIADGTRFVFPRAVPGGECAYEMAPVGDIDAQTIVGACGILEPSPSIPACSRGELDGIAWLVPGVAFGTDGARLGRGKGVYDRLLAGVTGVKIGVAYEWQVLAYVPHCERDIPVDILVTEVGARFVNATTKRN